MLGLRCLRDIRGVILNKKLEFRLDSGLEDISKQMAFKL